MGGEEKEEEKKKGRRWSLGVVAMLLTLSVVAATTTFAWRRYLFVRRLLELLHPMLLHSSVPPFSSGAALVIHPALSRRQTLLRHQQVDPRRRLLEMLRSAGYDTS